MDKADWKKVENTLCGIGSYIILQCDSYRVKLMRLPYKGLKDVIVPVIDGKMLTTASMNECEERNRFCCPHKRKESLMLCGLTNKEYNELSARKRKAVDEWRTYTVWYPWWLNFDAMRRHFEKNNKCIKIAEDPDESI